jgi:menaquinone-dependent protoporphyrinogen oxidase
MTTNALVAYASKHGSTAEIAVAIGDALTASGIETTVRPSNLVEDVKRFDAVIIGSAVQMNRWLRDALDFARRFERDLRDRPTWFFSSGPTGGTRKADAKVVELLALQPPPPGEARKWAERIGIRGHTTFGGRIGEGIGGIFERWVPRGDWRDFDVVTAWARGIASELGADSDAPRPLAGSRSPETCGSEGLTFR